MDVQDFKNAIEDIVDVQMDKRGIAKFISAKVSSVNNNGTINVYLPPDENNVITGLLNKTGETLSANDSVELCTKNGKIKNAWVALRHSTNFIAAAGGDSIPIGTMVAYGNGTPPSNWLICDGSAISRTMYSQLFAVIGTSYGSGDGSTTFNLPNKKGKVSVGLDTSDTDFDTIGETGGEKEVQLDETEMPSHTHTLTEAQTYSLSSGEYNGIPASDRGSNTGTLTNSSSIASAGGDQAHNNLQPYQVDQWIIKAFKDTSAPEEAQVRNTTTTSTTDVYSCTYVNEHTASGDTLPINAIVDYVGSTIPSGYEAVSSTMDYFMVGLTSAATISKSSTYGGVDIPFSRTVEAYTDTDFSISNGRIYYNGTSNVRIQVNACIEASLSGAYLLVGATNGSYNRIGAFVSNNISGYTASVSFQLYLEPGDYVSCLIGHPNTFSGVTVYTDTKLDLYVLGYYN